MTTYKIGNQISCVIRAHNIDKIGNYPITWQGEPYTIISGENGTITFQDNIVDANSTERNGSYSTEKINTFTLYNVTLTDKILNLIYSKKEGFSITYTEKLLSDENKKIFLNKGLGKPKKMVFVYYSEGVDAVLEAAYSDVDGDEIEVEHADSYYNVVYEVITNNIYSLDKRSNIYVTLDISSVSNTDEETSTVWVHIDRAVVRVNKTFYFNGNANAVDLTFAVINNEETQNYIAWED